jgi:hypothetical protein
VQWTNDAKQDIATSGKLSKRANARYRRDAIKQAVLHDSHGKCMYCEVNVTAGAYGDIEHMKPKSSHVDDMYEWSNLGVSCDVCNTNKSNIYDKSLPFVNPYDENPSDFFEAEGAYVFHKPGNKRGEVTEQIIDLNRGELLEKRGATLKQLRHLLDKYFQEDNPLLKQVLKRGLELERGDDKEFAFISRATIDRHLV